MRFLIVLAILAVFFPFSSAKTQTLPSARNDAETLLSQSVGLAWQMLRKDGAFHPYGAAMTHDNRIVTFCPAGTDQAASRAPIARLTGRLVSAARSGAYKATALIYGVRVVAPDGNETDAVAVSLDHEDGYSALVFLPYRLADGRVKRAKVFTRKGRHRIFRDADG